MTTMNPICTIPVSTDSPRESGYRSSSIDYTGRGGESHGQRELLSSVENCPSRKDLGHRDLELNYVQYY